MKPSSQHLSHDFPCYRGVTLRELLIILIGGTALFSFIGMVVGLIIHHLALSLLVFTLTGMALCGIRGPSFVARLKEGKPQGYISKHIRIVLEQNIKVANTYRYYSGPWAQAKRIK